VFKNEYGLDDVFDIHTKNHDREKRSHDKMAMAIAIYFPALEENLTELYQVRAKLNSIIDQYKRTCKKGDTDGSRLFQSFHAATGELAEVIKKFEKAIVDMARRIASRRSVKLLRFK